MGREEEGRVGKRVVGGDRCMGLKGRGRGESRERGVVEKGVGGKGEGVWGGG